MDGRGPSLVAGLLPVAHATQSQLALPVLLRMMALVAVPREELERRIDAELRDNPMLERRPGAPCVACGRHTARGLCPSCRRSRPPVAPTEPVAERSPADVLSDAVCAELPSALRPVVAGVIGSLDDRGLSTVGVDELARAHGCDPAMVQRVLDAVRCWGPPGIAAPTGHACLLDQARWLVAHGQAPAVLVAVVADHLADVADGRLDDIAAATGEPLAAVVAAVATVRARLRPWITWGSEAGTVRPPPPPDVVVWADPAAPGGLRAEVTDRRWFGVRVAELPPRCAGAAARSWAEPWQERARALVRQLDTRAGALQAVADAMVDAQHDYLCRRRIAPEPLTRTDVASLSALSVSTVSRVVQGKHVRIPDGRVVPMASLVDPTSSARHAVGEALRRSPRSTDAEISADLAGRGLRLARRTVAKYRAQLGIASSRERPEAAFA